MTATAARRKDASPHPAGPTLDRFSGSRRERPPNPTATDAAASLDAWFDHVLPRVFGYFITRVGGDVHSAEDLTQETMLAAVDSRGFASADEPLAWLFGIARHKLLDHYRRQDTFRQRHNALDEHVLAAVPDDLAMPELDVERAQTRDAIIACLNQLPPRQRSAIVLRYLDGLDVPTTASMLGVSVHAAESLLARGRRTFRNRFPRASTREGTA